MKLYLDRFYRFVAEPLFPWARIALFILSFAILFSFTQPLWKISMEAPQYPSGLFLEIYSYKIEGGNNGQHLQEINTLNHYIGMRSLDRAAMTDLDWIPFAFGALFIFGLRVALIGNVSALVDLVVMSLYVGLFGLGRFVYMLYTFGHDLRSDAPMKIAGFMPAILGTKKIANFTTHSYPQGGTILIGVFTVGVILVLLIHLAVGRRRAVRAAESEAQTHRQLAKA